MENAYQAAKLRNLDDMWWLACVALFVAKAEMRAAKYALRADWGGIKLSVVADLVTQKFMNSPELAQMLRDAGSENS